MPLADGLDYAEPLYKQLCALRELHDPRPDSFFYNGGTVVAISASAAAAATAGPYPIAAAILSAVAASVVAISRSLDLGGRWRWHLRRQSAYDALLYRLNEAAFLPEDARSAAVRQLYSALVVEQALDAGIPGASADNDIVAPEVRPDVRERSETTDLLPGASAAQ